MTTVYEQFGNEYGVQYNESKSKTMLFGEHSLITRNITVCGKKLEWVNRALHLGNTLSVNLNDYNDTLNKKCKFYQNVNYLLAKFGSLQSEVLYILFNTYCTSFYGSQIWDLVSVYIDS